MTLGKRRAEWVLRLLAADVAALVVAFLVAYRLRAALDDPIGRVAAPLGHYLWLLGLIVPVWVGLLAASGAYGMGWTTRSRFWLVLRVAVVGLLAITAGLFLGKAEEVNRSVLLLFSGVSAVALWAERALVLAWLRHSRGRERWWRVALVVGTGDRARGLVAALVRYPEAGWVVRGCLSMDPADPTPTVLDTPVIGSLGDLPELLQGDLVVDEVFFAVPPERLEVLADALETCESLGVDTRVLVDMYRPAQAHPFVEELFGLPFYGFSPTLTRQGVLGAKRVLDVAGAAVLLVVLFPIMIGIGAIIG